MTAETTGPGVVRSTSHRDGWSRAGEALALLLLLGAAGLGLYARFVDLGIRQLAVDEYYFVTSVRSIIEHGVPVLTGGGYYVRGLLQQYLTAGAVVLFGDGGFAYRLPAVLFNLGAIVAAYVYARRHLSRPLALLLPALLLVSSWEVEFARFARMYAAFQFTTLLLLVVVDRVLAGDRRAVGWLPPVLLLNLMTHQLALLFLPVLALPLIAAWVRGERLAGNRLRRLGYLAASIAVASAAYLLGFANLRNRGVVDRFPDGFEAVGGRTLQGVPLAVEELAVAAVLVVGSALVYRVVLARRKGRRLSHAAAWGWAAAIFASIHALLPVLVCLAVIGGRYGATRRYGEHEARRMAVLALVVLTAWAAIIGAVRPDSPSMARALLGWPNLVDPIVHPWRNELPVLGLVIMAGLVGAFVLNIREPLTALLRHPAAPIAYVLIAFGVLESLYVSTRYTFFLYPVALLTVIMVAAKVSRPRPAIGTLAVAMLFAFSGDFNPTHLLDVSSREVSWRTGRFEGRAATWYARQDFEGPADYVDSAVGARSGASSVLVIGLPAMSEYIDVPHAIYYDRATDPRFVFVSRARGTVDLWSGERLLSTREDVRDYVLGFERVWVVAASDQQLPPAVLEALPGLEGAEAAYVSRDGRIRVRQVAIEGDRGPGD